MKINVVSKEDRFSINVKKSSTIFVVKEIIKNFINATKPSESLGSDENEQNKNNQKSNSILLYHNGALLHDACTVDEIGLGSGATIHYQTVDKCPYKLKVSISCLSTIVELQDDVISLTSSTIGDVKSILQNRLGIPVSAFNLKQNDFQRTLFDCHSLSHYGIRTGDTLVLELWKGMEKLIVASLSGDISRTMATIPSYHDDAETHRYYLKVALFIAAHMDYVNLAAQAQQHGVRSEEPVGEHPFRQWCLNNSHIDVYKAPVHQAAMRGSFRTLSTFLRHSPTCIVAKDGRGLTPAALALGNEHKECWKLLVVTQFQFNSAFNLSLNSYAKIMMWYNKAKDRLAYFKIDTSKKQMLLQTTLYPTESTYVGARIVVSGFNDTLQSVECSASPHWSYNISRSQSRTLHSRKTPIKGILRKPIDSTDKGNKANKQSEDEFGQVTSASAGSKTSANALANVTRQERKTVSFGKPKGASPISGTDRILSRSRIIPRYTPLMSARAEAGKIIVKQTGKTCSQIANECFDLGQMFNNMKWSSQMNISLKCSINQIMKNPRKSEGIAKLE